MLNTRVETVRKGMQAKVIKAQSEYEAALHQAELLVAKDPQPGSKEADRLELLTVLIEDFENRNFPIDSPDPIEAIEFRMEEQGLRQKDLVPILGSRSRVSEVLARKRPLSVQMIRAVSIGLGIPVETLIADPRKANNSIAVTDAPLDWTKFPVEEMRRRGWFEPLKIKVKVSTEEMVKAFLAQLSPPTQASPLYRRTFRGDEVDSKSYYSILAWTARVLIRAKEVETKVERFEPARITPLLLKELAQLSWFERGPTLAFEFLAKCGIILVVEPRLPNSLVDGAAMLTDRRTPVIALTLRYDRIDYFWYTLLHELVHIWKHLNKIDEAFIDRVENIGSTQSVEKEANRIARDALIPRAIWKRSQAYLSPAKKSIITLANYLHVHPAIVAGRVQFETGRYDSFRELLGQGTVRKLFPDLLFNR